ncbi:MAG: carbohydrate ABC transporter permease [Ornithinimicrobium sp.]|jgi:alpha-glucoside transport system permease protein|uniref:carbohydrate ABC transporter permease n=1 Tax=Ornithinimicrobium sp. TaxID=1977084 RepID=UPI003D9BBB49
MTTSISGPASTAKTNKVKAGKVMASKDHGAGSGQGRAGWLVKIVLLIICLLWIIPVIGLLVTSLRTADAANATGWWTALSSPLDFTLGNYAEAAVEGNMLRAFVNSMAITLPATIIPIMVAAFAAYAFSFMHFPGRDVLFILIVSLLVVPSQVALVPLLRIYGDFGLNGTFPAAWLAHIGFGMPLAIFILRNYMASLPIELIESAKIDGASHFQTFWKLIIPISTPALASFAIFQFLWVWNDLLIALLFIGPGSNAPMTVQLAGLLGAQGQGWHLITAGGFLTMVVPLIVFLSLQRYFVRGMTAGSVKG